MEECKVAWDVLSIIGTIAFAVSGAIVAMEEEYDLFGVYLLGIVTAFGGGGNSEFINRSTCIRFIGNKK